MQSHTIVFPTWHMEDVARDANEADASSILNAYALAFHPVLLNLTGKLPLWRSAPALENPQADEIYIIPPQSRTKIETSWTEQAESNGSVILQTTDDRVENLKLLMQHPRIQEMILNFTQQSDLGESATAEQLVNQMVLTDDFQSLGVMFLLITLLSQAMYHYENIEETQFEELLLEAAKESLQGNQERTEGFFRQACEQLLESREKFYPVDAHLIDLCLLVSGMSEEEAQSLCNQPHQVNMLCSADSLQKTIHQHPGIQEILKAGIQNGKLSLVGGEQQETASSLLSLQSIRWQLQQGLHTYEKLVDDTPDVWGRMTFGLTTQLPLLLKRSGFKAAYHLILDDGIYPDEEQSHFLWEGRSGSVISALSRIPISIENASSLLKIPERLAEAMNHDHHACLVLARWPQLRKPWFYDLQRVHKYCQVLGKQIGLTEYFEETEDSGHSVNHEQRYYLSPFLDQQTGRNHPDVISRIACFWETQTRVEQLNWLRTTQQILTGHNMVTEDELLDSSLYQLSLELDSKSLLPLLSSINDAMPEAARKLTSTLLPQQQGDPGFMFMNTLSQSRTAVFEFSHEQFGERIPAAGDAIKHLQIEGDRTFAELEIPACGFVACPGIPVSQAKTTKSKVPLAGEFFLQTEHYHATIDPESGGLQRFRVHGSNNNLLSERLVYRMDGNRGTVARSSDQWQSSSGEPSYSKMIADSVVTTRTGPVVGEIEVKGRLLDPHDGSEIASFTKTYRAERGRKNLRITLEIDPHLPPTQLPDRSYYALRFAWSDPSATVKGNLQQSEYITGENRLESTGPLEIDDREHRITLIPHFLPFHQRTGMRMLDSLLIVYGETNRSFQYDIAMDAEHPAIISSEATTPLLCVPLESLNQPKSAWLYHVSALNVQLLHIEQDETAESCYRFDFIETEARHTKARFSLFRQPKKAWEVDFRGNVLGELSIENDQIVFEAQPCDYLSIRVQF